MSKNDIGTTIAIATGVPATIDSSGFGAMTYSDEIPALTSIGAVGDTNETTTEPDMVTGRNRTIKGAVTGDTVPFAIPLRRDGNALHPVMAAFKAAAQAQGGEYSIRITDADGSIQYIAGPVMNWKNTERSTTSYAGFTFDVALNYNVVDVDPT